MVKWKRHISSPLYRNTTHLNFDSSQITGQEYEVSVNTKVELNEQLVYQCSVIRISQ